MLSNTNAFEVQGLKDLHATNMHTNSVKGHVMGLPGIVVDSLRAVEAFKTTQGWNLFRRPAILMRKESTQIAEFIQEVEAAEGKKTIRRIFIGDRASGKSTLILQALAMAFLKDWVVINLPDAKELVIGHTEYAPLPGSNPTQYTQNMYTANLLSQIAKANAAVLSELRLTTKPNLPITVPPNATLEKLAGLGATNPEYSWPIFRALWDELMQPNRPPIVFAIDGLGHIMRNSTYMSADIKPIHAHDLTIVRHFVDHLSGTATLPNGGIILAAITGSNNPSSPALDFSLQVAEARAKGSGLPTWNPHKPADQRSLDSLKNVDVLRLNGLSKEEARTIMEYYAASGMLRRTVDNSFVSDQWTLSGGGNVGELERGAVKLRI